MCINREINEISTLLLYFENYLRHNCIWNIEFMKNSIILKVQIDWQMNWKLIIINHIFLDIKMQIYYLFQQDTRVYL